MHIFLSLFFGKILAVICALFLIHRGKFLLAWLTGWGVFLTLWLLWTLPGRPGYGWFWFLVLVLAVGALFTVLPLRKVVLSWPLLKIFKRFMPSVGETERIALEAGSVWWEKTLFEGRPDWAALDLFSPPPLSEAEKSFLEGPVNELCALLDDEAISQERALPEVVWNHLKRHGFFGMLIPEEHGGLGFSSQGRSKVVAKISAYSPAVAVVVMVPNSLGPAELILRYGTADQKKRYMGPLARGEEIPCFALTEPHAGSDAASLQSEGVVCHNAQGVLGVRLTFSKRYITLAPVATLVGLAFRLKDPQNLLGETKEHGITCALVPRETEGMEIGDHHDPAGATFPNGPVKGKDVFIPMGYVIGEREGVGQGWQMLMACLAEGRAVSLPALATGAAEASLSTTTAYATVRKQFGLPIGAFEGVGETMAEMAGLLYAIRAVRDLTCGALDEGHCSPVLASLSKAYMTEFSRSSVEKAMDIFAGAGICRGPSNLVWGLYTSMPIAITVEGANILTRSLMIFSQGVMRCHPYLYKEVEALSHGNLGAFDRALFSHLGLFLQNVLRTLGYGFGGWRTLQIAGPSHNHAYYRRLSWMSSVFATLSDLALLKLGGRLKRMEMISGRFSDIFAWLFTASSVLKAFSQTPSAHTQPLVDWVCQTALWTIEERVYGLIENLFPHRFSSFVMRRLLLPLGRSHRPPSDQLKRKIVRGLLYDGPIRQALFPQGVERGPHLEEALKAVVEAQSVDEILRAAIKKKVLKSSPRDTLLERALEAGLISERQVALVHKAEELRDRAVQVDSFNPQEYRARKA